MITFPAIGTKIWASIVTPGMVVRTPDGIQIEVDGLTEEYGSFTFDTGTGRSAKVDYADLVEVIGYFNPGN